MNWIRHCCFIISTWFLASCASSQPRVVPQPHTTQVNLAHEVSVALEGEFETQTEDRWLHVLKMAMQTPNAPFAQEAILASLDALVDRKVYGLDSFGEAGIAFRSSAILHQMKPFLDSFLTTNQASIARIKTAIARMRMATIQNDAQAYASAREASGCVREATVVGPFVEPTLTAFETTHRLEQGHLDTEYLFENTKPFALNTKPTLSTGRGCSLDITGTSKHAGVRYLVVDFKTEGPEEIFVGLDTALPARVYANRNEVFSINYSELDSSMLRVGTINVAEAGWVRLTIKLAAHSIHPAHLFLLHNDGRRVQTVSASAHAPFTTRINSAHEVRLSQPTLNRVDEHATYVLSLLAQRDLRRAEAWLSSLEQDQIFLKNPIFSTLYARTLAGIHDIPHYRKLERLYNFYESTLRTWPHSWEALIGLAHVISQQRHSSSNKVDAIVEIQKRIHEQNIKPHPIVYAYLAYIGDGVLNTRNDALAKVHTHFANTIFEDRILRATRQVTKDIALRSDCGSDRNDWSRWDCITTSLGLGNSEQALKEIERLRTFFSAPKFATEYQLEALLRTTTDKETLRALYNQSDVLDRTIHLARSLAPVTEDGFAWLSKEARILAASPTVIQQWRKSHPTLDQQTHEDFLSFAKDTPQRIQRDRVNPAYANVGTVILEHREQYQLNANGVLNVRFWDVRRLDGTSDVEANAAAQLPAIQHASGQMQRIIHRIYKSDGRQVEPDRIDTASQANAELSQIQPGDYVELFAEGTFILNANGAFDIDTPNLLPSRTAVVNAEIEFVFPKNAPISVWHHAELSQAKVQQNESFTRTLFQIQNHNVLRLEKGQSQADSLVGVRASTFTWARLGQESQEGLLAQKTMQPDILKWVRSWVPNETNFSVEQLARLSKLVKRAIPRVSALPAQMLTQSAQRMSARTMLIESQGSRVALMHHALNVLGISNEVVWAERSPYSSDLQKMVPRTWRFTYPMLLVYLKDSQHNTKPIWLDLDTDGAPLPPGFISPELRGRSALTTQGQIIALPDNASEETDVAQLNVTVDSTGSAQGSFSLLLRGQEAQEITSVLEEEAGEQRTLALRAIVLGWLPEANVIDVNVKVEATHTLLQSKVALPLLLNTNTSSTQNLSGLPPLHIGTRPSTLGSTYTSQAQRTTALSIRHASHYVFQRTIQFASTPTIIGALPNFELRDPQFSLVAKRSATFEASTLIDRVEFSLMSGVIASNQFQEFSRKARLIDDAFLSTIRIRTHN